MDLILLKINVVISNIYKDQMDIIVLIIKIKIKMLNEIYFNKLIYKFAF